jgi:uncharacterized membrane protein
VYDTLLFLHVLSAAITFITVVMFSAYALGAVPTRGSFFVADMAWNVSGAGLVIFGIWLALYVDGYEIWDGWILGALVLFGLASFFGARARLETMAVLGDGGGEPSRAQVTMWHWLRAASVVAILVLMIWKPGA